VQVRRESTSSNFTTTRLVPQLFYASEILYGSFGLLNANGYTYLFAQDTTGIKMARVTTAQLAKRASVCIWPSF